MNNISRLLKRNSSSILTIISVVGVIGTAVSVAKDTPKVLELLNYEEHEKGEKLTTVEKIKISLPAYIPSIAIGLSTIVCILGNGILNKRTQASIISTYTLLDKSHKQYIGKLKELYGEETHQNIVDAIASDKPYIGTTGAFYSHSIELNRDQNDILKLR